MPGGDRTGPMGLGPMTGRGAGFCGGYAAPGFANFAPGRGFWGWGRGGGGHGRRNRFYATGLTGWQRAGWGWPGFGWGAPIASAPPAATREQELSLLNQQAQELAQTLEQIKQRIAELAPEQQ